MVPCLAIAAFAGLRAAEIQRLDWSEIHLTGAEKFIEVKAGKAKTASRRTVPVSRNLDAWLAPHAQPSGPVVEFVRADKQLFITLAAKSGVEWKRNGLRHSFISYRLGVIKDVGQVALEAGDSPAMVSKNYRQLVTETAAKEWFAIMPAKQPGGIIPMPTAPRCTTWLPNNPNA
jgi:integrase